MRRSLRFILLVSAAILAAFGAPNVMFAQTGVFSGTVLADPSEKPLANVEIAFTELNRTVRSDNAGNFVFSGLPLGKHNVSMRLVGFEPLTTVITLVDAKPLEVDLFLKQTTTVLKNVEVKAAGPYAMRLVDFEERRRIGGGRFLTAEFFEQQQGRPLSSFLMQKIPGINFVQSGSGRYLATNARGANGMRRGFGASDGLQNLPPACYAQIIINGIVRYDGSQKIFNMDELNSLDVIGFEFYTTATTPLQYNRTRITSGCGTAIIWTK